VFPAICEIGVDVSFVHRANALSETELKRGSQRKHHQKKMKSINPERRKPKGINLRGGEV